MDYTFNGAKNIAIFEFFKSFSSELRNSGLLVFLRDMYVSSGVWVSHRHVRELRPSGLLVFLRETYVSSGLTPLGSSGSQGFMRLSSNANPDASLLANFLYR